MKMKIKSRVLANYFILLFAIIFSANLAFAEEETFTGELDIVSDTTIKVDDQLIFTDANTDYFKNNGDEIDRSYLENDFEVKVWAEKEGEDWIAYKLKILQEEEQEEVDVEGEISSITDSTVIIDGTEVHTTNDTYYWYRNGYQTVRDSLKVGMDVEAKTVKVGEKYTAYKIWLPEQEEEEDYEVRGELSELGNDSFEVDGKLIKTNADTRYYKNDEEVERSALENGLTVEVKYVKDGDNNIAIKVWIEDEEEEEDYEVRGELSELGNDSFEVDGKLIKTNTDTRYYKNDEEVERSALENGLTVEVKYVKDGDNNIAIKVWIEDEEEEEDYEVRGELSELGNDSFEVDGKLIKTNTDTRYYKNDEEVERSALENGLTVEVKYVKDGDNNIAIKVWIEDEEEEEDYEVRGELSELGNDSFEVDGKLIKTNADTRYYKNDEEVERSALENGLTVEVKYVKDGDNNIAIKVWIEDEEEEEDYEVRGELSELGNDSFEVDGKLIKTNADTRYYKNDEEVERSALENGLTVEVKYVKDGDNNIAIKVWIEDEDEEEDGEVEGIVTEVNDDNFQIGSILIYTNDDTQYYKRGEGFVERSELQEGIEAEAKFYWDGDSRIATKVIIEDEEDEEFEFEGTLSELTESTFQVGAYVITTNDDTRYFLEKSGQTERSSLENGLKVEVKGFIDGDNYIATKVKIEEEYEEIEGIVTEVADVYFMIGDTKVLTNEDTRYFLEESGWTDRSDLVVDRKVEVTFKIVDDEYVAIKVWIEEEYEDEELDLTGNITFLGDDYFTVNETDFYISENTLFFNEFGDEVDYSYLEIDNEVEVHSVKDGDNYYATKVEIEDEGDGIQRETKEISTLNSQSMMVDGKIYRFDQDTDVRFKDNVPANLQVLRTGMRVDVIANLKNGERIADRVMILDEVSLVDYGNISTLSVSTSPNPYVESLNINIDLSSSGEFKIDILDINGNTVSDIFTGRLTKGEHQFNDLANYPAGVYFVRFISGSNAEMIKVIKTN